MYRFAALRSSLLVMATKIGEPKGELKLGRVAPKQQRVSIARSLINGDQIILADEPTGLCQLVALKRERRQWPRALKSRGRIFGKLSDFAPGDKPGSELFAVE